MVLKKIDTQFKVSNYAVAGINVVLIFDDKILLNQEILLTTDVNAGFYNFAFFVNDSLLIYGNLTLQVRFNLDTNDKKSLNPAHSFYWDTFRDDQIIVSFNRRKLDTGRRVVDYYKYDFVTGKLTDLNITAPPSLHFVNNVIVLLEDDQRIVAYDFPAIRLLWELNLEQTGKELFSQGKYSVKQIIGSYNDRWLLALSNREIISVDIKSGKVLWHTNDFISNHLTDWRNNSSFSFSYWYLEDDKIYQLDGNTYLSVDLNSHDVTVLWQDTSSEGYVTVMHSTYARDYVYFTGSKDYATASTHLGVFNRRTFKIESIIVPEGLTGSLNQAPIIMDNRLYARDSGGTLHIFQKEFIDNN